MTGIQFKGSGLISSIQKFMWNSMVHNEGSEGENTAGPLLIRNVSSSQL